MKKFVFSEKDNNHIKFLYLDKENEIYDLSSADQLWDCEKMWNRITRVDLKTPFFKTHKKTGFILAVIDDPEKNYVYFVQTLTNEYPGHENVTVIVNERTEENTQDFISIATMLNKNLIQIGRDYKKQIIDGKVEYKKFLKKHEPNSVLANPIREE